VTRRVSGVIALLLSLGLVGCESGGGVAPGNILGAVTQGFTGVNPAEVRAATTDIDEPEEIELGRAVSTALGSRYKLLRDEPITRYVALVGNTVAVQSDRPDLRYYFGVLDTDEINAFAAPGGYVFVTRGTLALMRDEATLAGVLGHEVGHIALRHHNETIKKERQAALQKAGFLSAASLGLSFVNVGSVGGNTALHLLAPTVIKAGADAVSTKLLSGFSQKEESEADGVGFKYAARASYDPSGLRDFLQAVKDSGTQPAKAGVFANWAKTHPGTDDRLKDQESQLKTVPAGGRRAAARFQTAMNTLPKSAAPPAPPTSSTPATKPAPPTR
jgi:predicted Zn-dependent protease